jgi:hypothetical protein
MSGKAGDIALDGHRQSRVDPAGAEEPEQKNRK